ncbi:MAG: hypothetical protein IJ091_11380 [Oscillospiraceae bacterium]|nr:hypothetical protein [Oscillospiraceae bacterium]MBQ8996401.1 hypothetical protein [Oscillospiraceae bacterium]
MTKADILVFVQSDLDMKVIDSARTAQLNHLIDSAVSYIEREGVAFTVTDGTYNFTAEEADVVEMYACYLFRKRKTDEGMPRMLRWSLNNLLFSQKARVSDAT